MEMAEAKNSGKSESARFRAAHIFSRILALVFCVVALSLIVFDKQTVRFLVSLPGLKTPFSVSHTAKFSDVKGVSFYTASLILIVAYLFLQLLFGLFQSRSTSLPSKSNRSRWIIFFLDQAMAFLLASAAAVSAEVGYIAKHGESKVGWKPTCHNFKHYCTLYGFSLVNSYLAFLAFLPMVAISAYHASR